MLHQTNMANKMVGHIKREVAARLAPLIDANLIVVDGVMDGRNMSGHVQYNLPMSVRFLTTTPYLPLNQPRSPQNA